ncbi:transposase [Paraburkholderia sp. CNPSo 3274]|uniref:transposase n=1 Tax=Paraburkholderia sp. CNPSo 3274 TaxID=2940932 RepID=UPI0020B7F0F1|nr:transposase [Paraburkholderia sp. CNPSo 3274]MCP3713357.1 transposase [Paraburkholderia sp. CNPSo 3274]
MAANHGRQAIPTKLTVEQFEQFILPHLGRGRRGPPPTLPLQKMFNYVLKALYMGCQWKMLPIETNALGLPEIHHTRIYRIMRRWQADGSIDRVFAGSVDQLHRDPRLDLSTIHGDGTTTAAKKGGDNLGYSGHKHLKGDKVVAFCDRKCNIIAPFVSAPGNRNESPLLRDALSKLTAMARAIGADLQGSTVSLDGVYDCRENRRAIFNRGMRPALFGWVRVPLLWTHLSIFDANRPAEGVPQVDEVGDDDALALLRGDLLRQQGGANASLDA